MPGETTLRLAFSPDADDAFMFRAAVERLIDTEGLVFLPTTFGTQNLNEMADREQFDISAISVAAYPFIAAKYAMLDHGGSVGRNYGPVIVGTHRAEISALESMTIGTPGERTTAHFVARLIAPGATYITIPISPYNAIFESVESGDVDAAIIIHEGRLTYEQHGLYKIVDLGEWWFNMTGLPLPLGANVIRRGLGESTISTASRVLRRSIRWALDNRDEMLRFLTSNSERPKEVASLELVDRYLNMYANEETFQYLDESRNAMKRMYEIGHDRGLFSTVPALEFV